MTTALPHSNIIHGQLTDYLHDIETQLSGCSTRCRDSNEFRGLFKNSLAAYTVLSRLARRERVPLLKAASEIVRRLPLLVALQQLTPAYVELRRFLELIAWYAYFREHLVEWATFREDPGRGYVNDRDSPIAACAHREFRWFVCYAKERYRQGKSDQTINALDEFTKQHGKLSAFVHAATAVSNRSSVQPFERVDPASLRAYQRAQKSTLSSGCIVAASARPGGLARLNAVERAWFNWLVGAPRARSIAATSLGL